VRSERDLLFLVSYERRGDSWRRTCAMRGGYPRAKKVPGKQERKRLVPEHEIRNFASAKYKCLWRSALGTNVDQHT